MVTNITIATTNAQNTSKCRAHGFTTNENRCAPNRVELVHAREMGGDAIGARNARARARVRNESASGTPMHELDEDSRQNGRTRSIPRRIAKREDPIYSPPLYSGGGGINQGPPGVGFRQPDWAGVLGSKADKTSEGSGWRWRKGALGRNAD